MSKPDRDQAQQAGEAQLAQACSKLRRVLAQHPADDQAVLQEARTVYDLAADLALGYREAILQAADNSPQTHSQLNSPTLADWLRNREQPPIRPAANLARLTYAAATAEVIERCWRKQAQTLGVALNGLVQNDKAIQSLWMYWQDGQNGREAGLPFFRAEAIRNAAADLVKLQELLIRPPTAKAVVPGELLFQDDFVALAPNWKAYGNPTELRAADSRLTLAGEGCAVWLERDFEDVRIAFDYTPVKLAPRAGALFAFPGNPMPGQDWADAAGPMEKYNRSIATYHASLCRGGTGMTNLRRTGMGLRMLSTVQPDPCAELGRTYHVEILSAQGSLYVLVDGQLQHAYADAGVHGPILRRGRFGIRLFAGGVMEMQMAHFRVHQLLAK